MGNLPKELIKHLQTSLKYEVNVDEDIVDMLMKIFMEAYNWLIKQHSGNYTDSSRIKLARRFICRMFRILAMQNTDDTVNKIKIHIPVVIRMIVDDKNNNNEVWNVLLFKKYIDDVYMPNVDADGLISYINNAIYYKKNIKYELDFAIKMIV